MKWSYIEGDTDVALVHYATTTTIEDHCTWQSFTLDYLLSFYNKPTFNRCVDIGANYGFLSVGFAKYFKNVESFEISSVIREHLLHNTSTIGNIKVHPKGLYNKEGEVQFKLLSNSGMSRITTSSSDTTEEVTTLDSYSFDNVDLIKIDAEHSELEVIQGSLQTIEKYKPVLVVEMDLRRGDSSLENRQQIFDILFNLGYYVADIRHNDVLFLTR